MKKAVSAIILICFLLFVLPDRAGGYISDSGNQQELAAAQERVLHPGGYGTNPDISVEPVLRLTSPGVENIDDAMRFTTTVFTFNNITIFSYFDDTEIKVVNAAGASIYSGTLLANKYHNLTVPTGIYRILGSKSYTVLVGDAVSNIVQGFFAVDQSGLGTSTLFNTYMMGGFVYKERFIVFGYEDGTEFTVRNLDNGSLLYAGTLNAGQHFTMPDTPYETFLQVSSNKPVSALSYGDQDYYVPSSNGTFTGTLFYGYSGYIGSWTNSITVTAYEDDTDVTVVNTETGEPISNYKLNAGQVHTDPITSEVYWRVISTKPVTAANIPYAGWSSSYYYMTRAIDQTGIGSGKLFYVPTIGSRIDVFSFVYDNQVKVTELGKKDDYPYPGARVIFDGKLNEGEVYTFNSSNGQFVYKVESTGNVSVLQSNGGAGADFMPLSFALELPDLAVSTSDIEFTPTNFAKGETVTANITVHNYGPFDALNIKVEAYDSDPDGGGTAPLIASRVINKITGMGKADVAFQFVVPDNPEFRNITIKVDPAGEITESNESNNKASKPLIPNKDLLPPLSVSVKAPSGLILDNDGLRPNPFKVTATIFNTSAAVAENVYVEIKPLDGLSLYSGELVTKAARLSPNEKTEINWELQADPEVSGSNRYQLIVGASNAEAKEVNRLVTVPDNICPGKPEGVTAAVLNTGAIDLKWSSGTERDIAGYKIFYGTSKEALNGTGAHEGDSPIVISPFTQYTLTGLSPNNKYYFAIKAFDASGNESEFSDIVSPVYDTPPPGSNSDSGSSSSPSIPALDTSPPVLEGFTGPLEVVQGQNISLPGTISSKTDLTKVTIGVVDWNDNVDSKVPDGKTFNMNNFTIDTSTGFFANPGIYIINVRAKSVGCPDPQNELGRLNLVVKPQKIDKFIRIFINNRQLITDKKPYIKNGKLMVPLRSLLQELGAEVGYQENQGFKVWGIKGSTKIELTAGKTVASVNGKPVDMDCALEVKGGSTFVPLRFVATAFGYDVDWRESEQAAYLTSIKKQPVAFSVVPNHYTDCDPATVFDLNGDLTGDISIGASTVTGKNGTQVQLLEPAVYDLKEVNTVPETGYTVTAQTKPGQVYVAKLSGAGYAKFIILTASPKVNLRFSFGVPTTSLLKADGQNGHTVLSWDALSDAQLGYNIYRYDLLEENSYSVTLLNDFTVGETTFTDNTAQTHHSYGYVAAAIKNNQSFGTSTTAAYFSPQPIQRNVRISVNSAAAMIDGKPVTMVLPAVIKNGRMMVPASFLTNIGVQVVYDQASDKLTLTRNLENVTYTLVMTVNDPEYTWNGTAYKMDVPPYMTADRIMVPIRVVAPALAYGLSFDSAASAAAIQWFE